MSKKYRDKTSKVKIPIKPNAKVVVMGDKEVTIPVLSIYHNKLFGEIKGDNFYETLSPIVNKIYDNPTKSQFSFIIAMLLSHNNVIKREIIVDDETFSIDGLKMRNNKIFIVDDVEYEFDELYPDEIFESPLELLSNKLIGDPVDFTQRKISFEFMKVYFEYYRDVYIIGSKGTILEGLINILNEFEKGE